MKTFTPKEIKDILKETLEFALESVNQDCCNIEVKHIDRENRRVLIEFDLEIDEENEYVGFEAL